MFFNNEYDFLSNFYQSEVNYKGNTFYSVEAAFQAQKDPSRSHEFRALNPSDAKKLGRKVTLRSDWEKVKFSIMEEILRIKFSDPVLLDRLLNVKGEIVEDNTWGDRIWGRCGGLGENNLGKILMKIRDEQSAILTH